MSLLAMATAMSQKKDWQQDEGPVTPEVRAKMRETFGLGEWNVRIGLYGITERMDVDQRIIEEAVGHIDGIRIVSREYAGDAKAEEVFPPDQAMAGIPNMDLLRMLDWYGYEKPGHVAYAPIAPQTGVDGRVLHELVTRHANDEMGQDFGEAFYLTGRTMQFLVLILFDASDTESLDKTFSQTAKMIDETAGLGCGEYRAHTAFMDKIAEHMDFNGGAALRLTQRIKDALDPKGILSPGKSGIWPERFRDEDAGARPLEAVAAGAVAGGQD